MLHETAELTALYLVPAEASDAFHEDIGALAQGSGLATWWRRAEDRLFALLTGAFGLLRFAARKAPKRAHAEKAKDHHALPKNLDTFRVHGTSLQM